MGIFKIFTENSFMHIIAFNPRIYKAPVFPFILRCVQCVTLAFDF